MPQRKFFEAPRSKLFRLANLRGLLQPDYPHGVKSRIREVMIFRDLQRELESETYHTRAIVEAAFTPLIDPKKFKEHYQDTMGYVTRALSLANLNSADSLENYKKDLQEDPKFQEAIKAFQLLKGTNVASILASALKN